jgi:ABC-type polysaccharide/polyol phosphate export permease
MPVKVVDVDINELESIEGLSGYDGVEILFRAGREPLGRAHISCNGDSLDAEKIRPLIDNLPVSSPLDLPDKLLPTVTVAICTRNRLAELSATLESLARQEYPPDEILVVDNGCQDEVSQVVARILPHARYLQERRPGLDFARNRALSETASDIIAFLDDDAEADPYWVKSIAETFATYEGAGALAGLTPPLELETRAQQLFEAQGGYMRGFSRRILPQDSRRLFGFRAPLVAETTDVGTGCNMAFRTNVLKRLQGFDEALDTGPPLPGGGDLDMLHRVTRAGYELVYEPRAIVRHRHRRTEAELKKQLTGHQRAFMAFLMKTICEERGWARVDVALFIGWRLAKAAYRMFWGLFGRRPLPFRMLVRVFLACLVGLGSYHASKWRIKSQTRHSGGSRPRLTPQLWELWHYREFIWNLTVRDLKVKYQRSWLGFFWTLFNPLVTVGVLIAVFSYVVRIPIKNYWAFLISGYFAFNFFSQTLNGGVAAAVGNAYLTRTSYFPQEVLVLSSTFARLLEFLGELAIVLVLLALFHHKGLPFSFIWVLPLVSILFFLAVGISFPLVTLAVYYEDTVQAIPLATMTLFYLTPVFYHVDFVPESIRGFYYLNPMTPVLELYHAVLYRGEMPEPGLLIALFGLAMAVGLYGYILFSRKKREFAEIV